MKGEFMETKTNLYVCEVEFMDEISCEQKTEHCLCNASNYAKCTHELEYMYGAKNIISMKMFALEEGPITITEDLAKRFVETEWGEPIN